MRVPDWKTFDGGTRNRVALWLLVEVGPGGVFTKAQLRDAFPNVEQVDRRMRDLRPEGWVIHTNTQDVSLESDELRLVTVGGRVWERTYRSSASTTVSDAERRAVMLRDNFACTLCGISAGESYLDDAARTAVISVVRGQGFHAPGALHTVCSRCRGGSSTNSDAAAVLHELEGLDPTDLNKFTTWLLKGRRIQSPLDNAWLHYLGLPLDQRNRVEDAVLDD